MDNSKGRASELVARPTESLAIELKRWINPNEPAGIAIIVRAVLALRNHGGGYLLIGFDDRSRQPDFSNAPAQPELIFHIDVIQAIVSKYASEPFEIEIILVEREHVQYPVIVVPSGVKTPVAVKADLHIAQSRLLNVSDVYIRSLNSNNVPSSTKAGWKDWTRIVEICLDNREADIARFVRRHLAGLDANSLLQALSTSMHSVEPTAESKLAELLEHGKDRLSALVKERSSVLPAHGSLQIALIVQGTAPPHATNQAFLNLLNSSNPNYTGWPIWMGTQASADQAERPFVVDGGWEAFLVGLGAGWDHIDFIRFDPVGKFYHYRALEDDVGSSNSPTPQTSLEFGISVLRPAEAIAVGLEFARAMGYAPDSTTLAFAFRWSGLKGRTLASWASRGHYMPPGRTAHQDELTTFVRVPLAVSATAISEFVGQAVQPLFNLFDGFELQKELIDDLVTRLLQRRL